jgi:hypothetical protein
VNLSKGRVGEGNARLLGSMLITKIYLAAMSRADEKASDLAKLPNLYLYVDEFQSFADKSFADILSEARKYKLNLTIAHQYIEQMEEEVRDAVFGNVGSMIVFRVGAYDAEVLEKEFFPTFTKEDLVNLGLRQIYLKLMIDGVTSQPFSATTLPPIKDLEKSFVKEIIENSRKNFSRPKAIVETEISNWHAPTRNEAPLKPKFEQPRVYRENPKPEYKKPEPRPVQQNPMPIDDSGFKPLKAVSLEDLKKKNDNQRRPSQQNMSDLRNALFHVSKNEPLGHRPTTGEAKPEPKAEAKNEPVKKMSEVHPDALRKILED